MLHLWNRSSTAADVIQSFASVPSVDAMIPLASLITTFITQAAGYLCSGWILPCESPAIWKLADGYRLKYVVKQQRP